MPAFAAVLDARSRDAAAQTHQLNRLMAAAVDRCGPIESRQELPLGIAWGHDTLYESAPSSIEDENGIAWLDGNVSNTPDEVRRILAHVTAGDVAACAALRGPAAVWSWCRRTRTLRVVADPFSRRPVHWARFPGGICAATEIRQVLAHPQVAKRLDPAMITMMLGQWPASAERTPYEGVYFLAPGHVLEVDASGRADVWRWWSWPDQVDHRRSFEDWVDEIRELTLQAVRSQLPSTSFGVTISGGLDSSLLAGMATELAGGAGVTALTMRFPELAGNETGFQDEVIGHNHLSELTVGPQPGIDYWSRVVADVERTSLAVPWIQPEQDALLGMARAMGLNSALRGVGGDEIFAPTRPTVLDAVLARRSDQARHLMGPGPRRRRLAASITDSLVTLGRVAPAGMRRRRRARRAPTWLRHDMIERLDLAHELVVPPRGMGESAMTRERIWQRTETTVAQEQAVWRDGLETTHHIRLVDPLIDIDLVAAMTAVPNQHLWAPGDGRHLQRRVAGPYVPSGVEARRGKVFMGTVILEHLCSAEVMGILKTLQLAGEGFVDPDEIARIHTQSIDALARGGEGLGGGPLAIAQILRTEALLRCVAM